MPVKRRKARNSHNLQTDFEPIKIALALAVVMTGTAHGAATDDALKRCKGIGAETYQERIEACTAVLESGTEREKTIALINRGESYFRYGQIRSCEGEPEEFELSLADMRQVRERDPYQAEAHLYIGRIHAGREQYEEAIKSYDKAVRRDRTNADAYRYRAKSYSQIGYEDTAFKDYMRTFEHGGSVLITFMQNELAGLSLYDGPKDGALNPPFRAALKTCIAQKLC